MKLDTDPRSVFALSDDSFSKDGDNEPDNESGWGQAYKEIVQNSGDGEYEECYFALANIDDNDIPELIVSGVEVYTYENGNAKKICSDRYKYISY